MRWRRADRKWKMILISREINCHFTACSMRKIWNVTVSDSVYVRVRHWTHCMTLFSVPCVNIIRRFSICFIRQFSPCSPISSSVVFRWHHTCPLCYMYQLRDLVSHDTSPCSDRDVSVVPQTRLHLVSPESRPGPRCRWQLANNCSTVHAGYQLDNDDVSQFSAADDEFCYPLKKTLTLSRARVIMNRPGNVTRNCRLY